MTGTPLDTLGQDTSVSLFFVGTIGAGLFAIYTWVQPAFRQIDINASRIEEQAETIESLESEKKEYNRHILNISKSLSRIEGRLEEINKRR